MTKERTYLKYNHCFAFVIEYYEDDKSTTEGGIVFAHSFSEAMKQITKDWWDENIENIHLYSCGEDYGEGVNTFTLKDIPWDFFAKYGLTANKVEIVSNLF